MALMLLVLLVMLYRLIFPAAKTHIQPPEMYTTLSCKSFGPIGAKTPEELSGKLNSLSSPNAPSLFCVKTLKSGSWEIYRDSVK
jgi:hypothetical protein